MILPCTHQFADLSFSPGPHEMRSSLVTASPAWIHEGAAACAGTLGVHSPAFTCDMSQPLMSRVEDAEKPILLIFALAFVFLPVKDAYQELLPTVIRILAPLPTHAHTHLEGWVQRFQGKISCSSVNQKHCEQHSRCFVGLLCFPGPFLWLFPGSFCRGKAPGSCS